MTHRILIAGEHRPAVAHKALSRDREVLLVRSGHALSGDQGAAVVADIGSADELTRIARAHSVTAIYAGADMAERACAETAFRLGLPGPPPAAVDRLNDGYALRQALAEHGVPCPRYGVAATVAQAREIARDIGLPVTVGTVHALGAQLTWQVDYMEDLPLAVARAIKGAPTPEVFVEAVTPGPRYYVDAVVSDSVVATGVTGRETCPAPFAFDQGLVAPLDLEVGVSETLAEIAGQAIRAVGLKYACVRVAIALAPSAPSVLNIQLWRPPDRVPSDLVQLAYGIDLLENALRLATGETPQWDAPSGEAWALRWLACSSGVVTAVEGVDEARAALGVHAVEVFITPGERVGHIVDAASRDRLGYVLARGATGGEALARADHARALCRIATAPTVGAATAGLPGATR